MMKVPFLLVLCAVSSVEPCTDMGQERHQGQRIREGNKAELGKLPFVVRIEYMWEGKLRFKTGVLISEKWVLSAWVADDNIVVRAGIVDLANTQHEQRSTAVVSKRSLNMVLLELEHPLFPNDYVGTIQLAEEEEEEEGEVYLTAGWGKTESMHDPAEVGPGYLSVGRAVAMAPEECPDNKTELCINDDAAGSPWGWGDVGGPLVKTNKKGESVLVGIAGVLSEYYLVSWSLMHFQHNASIRFWIRPFLFRSSPFTVSGYKKDVEDAKTRLCIP